MTVSTIEKLLSIRFTTQSSDNNLIHIFRYIEILTFIIEKPV